MLERLHLFIRGNHKQTLATPLQHYNNIRPKTTHQLVSV